MRTLLAAALAVGLGGLAYAQGAKNDPTGTWKWETEFGGQKRETVLKLKLEGDKLTGTITGGGRGGKGGKGGGKGGGEAKIEDGTYKNGEVAFSVTREGKDQKVTTKYKAKVEGDAMKGTIEGNFGGKEFKREFEAKREKKDN